jgi:hypothetical protein
MSRQQTNNSLQNDLSDRFPFAPSIDSSENRLPLFCVHMSARVHSPRAFEASATQTEACYRNSSGVVPPTHRVQPYALICVASRQLGANSHRHPCHESDHANQRTQPITLHEVANPLHLLCNTQTSVSGTHQTVFNRQLQFVVQQFSYINFQPGSDDYSLYSAISRYTRTGVRQLLHPCTAAKCRLYLFRVYIIT